MRTPRHASGGGGKGMHTDVPIRTQVGKLTDAGVVGAGLGARGELGGGRYVCFIHIL